jgi:hypothetical protein
MDLSGLVRGAAAIARSVTDSLQVTITHEAWIGNDAYGAPLFATAVARAALSEQKQVLRRTANGENVLSRTKLTFLDPISGNGADGRREPFDPRDRITLPDGTTGPILDVSGLADPTTSYPYMYEVYLG